MKKIIYIILLFIIVVPFQIKAQDDRNVYWVHGLEGNKNTFSLYHDTYHYERRINNLKIPTFSTKGGIRDAAIELFGQIDSAGPKTIFVTHSMGGLSSLQMLKDQKTPAFGGLITLGTPFLGAPVAKNIDDPIFVNLLFDMIIKGVPMNKTRFNILSSILYPLQTEINLVFGTNFSLLEDGLKWVLGHIKDAISKFFFGSDITKADLRPNSPAIASLQTMDMKNIPRVAIWGHEDDPTVLRLAGSVKEKAKGNGNLPLGQLGDQKITNLTGKIANGLGIASTICKIEAYTTLVTVVGPAEFFYAASQFKNSANFWRYELEPGLDQVVGSFRSEARIQTYQDWVCDALPYTMHLKSTNILQNCHWETKTRTVYVTVPTATDGVVPDFSAKAMPGVQSQCVLRANHINHSQLTNSYEVKAKLDKVFKGQVQDSRNKHFFEIPIR